jgi:hypothetical protein
MQEVTTTSMQWNLSFQNTYGLTMIKALPFSFLVSLECRMGLGLKIILAHVFIFST